MEELKDQIKEQFPEIILGEKLSKYSTFQIGGEVDFFYKVSDLSDDSIAKLIDLLKIAQQNNLPIFILGGGSNILFADEGFRGLIVKIESKNIMNLPGALIKVDAGLPIPSLIRYTVDNALTGLEPWMGLPGTVGGALRGNAGCNGLETVDVLKEATLLNLDNLSVHTVQADYFEFSYRKSKLKEKPEIVLNATFQLKERQESKEDQEAKVKEYNQLRMKKQPFGSTTGSFFKNPSKEQPAGMLIEQVGLKGHKYGKAQISDKHANFFLNLGGATAKEILQLSQLAQEKVMQSFGLQLEPEVLFLPEYGF